MESNLILIEHIARRALRLMEAEKIILPGSGERPVFYAWPRDDRVILVVDPERVRMNKVLAPDFKHDLSTVLAGRKVITTNSRGIYLQVAYEPEKAATLKQVPVDLTRQPTPLHVPIGMAKTGEVWLSVVEMDSALIGGSRRMGKTRILHGWIQALLHGGQARLFLWDGKNGLEFGRYAGVGGTAGAEGVRYSHDLLSLLTEIQGVMREHEKAIQTAGATSLADHNIGDKEKLRPVVLVIDELAAVPENTKAMLSDLVGRGGAYGVYPVFATTYPGREEVKSMVKANLSTRIALPVPTAYESKVILGQGGAEKLPKIKGRLLMVWNARLVEMQAFNVSLPEGTRYLGPTLDDRQVELVRSAIDCGGKMSMNLVRQFDRTFTEHSARKLLEDWERRGWLRKDARRDNARCVTPVLMKIYSQITGAGSIAGAEGTAREAAHDRDDVVRQ